MDRNMVYPGAIPLDTDVLTVQRSIMKALGFLAQATIGNVTTFDGLACTQQTVPNMTVQVGPGAAFSLQVVDALSFGSLGSDSSPLVKFGVNLGSTTLSTPAPGTTGQSINYLIEASYQESDATSVVLPYYNSSNPAVPYSGPANAGTPQNTQRLQTVSLQAKAGTPATTGTQTTPAADVGYTGLYVVTVAFGATSVVNANISTYASAPFIPTKLPYVRGNNIAVYQIIGGVQKVSINGAAFTTTGATTFGPIIGSAEVEIWGAGGGAGGTGAGTGVIGGSGGGGEYARGIFGGLTSATTVTCGPAGTAAVGLTAGGNGGATSFGALMTALGGVGGGANGGPGVAASGPGGNGGTGGTFRIPGGSGTVGFHASSSVFAAVGGCSFGTSIGLQSLGNDTAALGSQSGIFPGGGAGGTCQGGATAAGSVGCVIVRW